jgi:hypothetical protein
MKLMIQKWFTAVATLSLAGCANMVPIAEFAAKGNTLNNIFKSDTALLDNACKDAAEHANTLIAVGYPIAAFTERCKSRAKANVEMITGVTELLDSYHKTLGALADNTGWALSQDIEKLSNTATSLKAGDNKVFDGVNLPGFASAFGAIADLITSAMRQREAKSLLSAQMNWVAVLEPLRIWYGGTKPGQPGLYGQDCKTIEQDFQGLRARYLEFSKPDLCRAEQRCEPLWVNAVLSKDIDPKIKVVGVCSATGGSPMNEFSVNRVAAIDSWLASHSKLQKEAFNATPTELYAQLKDFQGKLDAIRKFSE